MTDDGQRTLSNFEEAREADATNSLFFKPETNTSYKLTFADLKDMPDLAHPHYKIVERNFTDFNDKSTSVKKVVVILQVESVNGKKVNQTWDVIPQTLRKMVEAPCTTGTLLKKVYLLQVRGEGKQKTYALSEDSDKK
jgi:hypothetical protein